MAQLSGTRLVASPPERELLGGLAGDDASLLGCVVFGQGEAANCDFVFFGKFFFLFARALPGSE